MITVSIESRDDVLSMAITHDECFDSKSLTDVKDKIEEVYDYIYSRDDYTIDFSIGYEWIESSADGNLVYVFYHSSEQFFERRCSRYDITILDDDRIFLQCYDGIQMVSNIRII